MKRYALGIGILAHNEQCDIAHTLMSLFQQSIFEDAAINAFNRVATVEISVVPNGCTDDTAKVAELEMSRLVSGLSEATSSSPKIQSFVHEVEMAGKSNAWNIYVHEASNEKIDLFVMMDADIEFNEVDTIKNTLVALLEHEQARIAVDVPLKSIHKKKNKSLCDRLSLLVSRKHLDGQIAVAGSFYCAWASTLRQVWMPVGLPAEDSFLKAMIVTDMFRKPVNMTRIVRAEKASHFYVPETALRGVMRHELRGVIGASINCYLTWDFLYFSTDPDGPGAGVVLRNLLKKDPRWLQSFLANTTRNKGYWVLPRGIFWGQIGRLRGKKLSRDLGAYLAVVLRGLLNVPIGAVANHKIKKGEGIGFW